MANDLYTMSYRNGDPIPQIKNQTEWNNATYGAWCWYDNNLNYNYEYYRGKLYNWYAITDSRGIAPVGYHIPTQTEYLTLTTYLGIPTPTPAGNYNANLLIQSAWWNNSRFGRRNIYGFDNPTSGHWTSTTAGGSANFILFLNTANYIQFSGGSVSLANGHLIRCIKD